MYNVLEANGIRGSEIISVEPLDVSELYFGKPIPQPLRPIVVRVNTISNPRNIWWAGGYLIVDLKWLAALQLVGESNFELFPVSFADGHGKRDDTSFRFMNLLNNVDCMDMNLSNYDVDEDGFVAHVWRLVIDESRIPSDRHLFRIKEIESTILASDALMEQVIETIDRGAKFVRVEDFQLR
jgi:hypothetical protein